MSTLIEICEGSRYIGSDSDSCCLGSLTQHGPFIFLTNLVSHCIRSACLASCLKLEASSMTWRTCFNYRQFDRVLLVLLLSLSSVPPHDSLVWWKVANISLFRCNVLDPACPFPLQQTTAVVMSSCSRTGDTLRVHSPHCVFPLLQVAARHRPLAKYNPTPPICF